MATKKPIPPAKAPNKVIRSTAGKTQPPVVPAAPPPVVPTRKPLPSMDDMISGIMPVVQPTVPEVVPIPNDTTIIEHDIVVSKDGPERQGVAPTLIVDENLEHTPPTTHKRGKGKNPNFMSFADAKEFIQNEMIPSRGKFEEWFNRNLPKSIPKYPYRVYIEEWVSWNDFLGTSNSWNTKRNTTYRPLLEAAQWVNKKKIPSYKEWLVWCKIPGNLPEDIPARPDLVYPQWRSWKHWLGNTTIDALQVQQEQVYTQVLYVLREGDMPENVLTVGIEPNGLTALKEKWIKEKFEVVKVFWYDPDKASDITQIIDALSTPYLGSDRHRITSHPYEIVWQLSNLVRTITKA